MQSHIYLSRWKTFLGVLATVFAVEAAVMVVLPVLLPLGLDRRIVALTDACLLTFSAAPLLWWLVVRPLRAKAMTESAKAESIVAAVGEGIVTFDERGLVDSFNPAAEQILGYRATEVVGQSVEALLSSDRPLAAHGSKQPTGNASFAKSAKGAFEVLGKRKDGSRVPLQLSVSRLAIEGRRLSTGVFRDLTEQKHRAQQQAAVADFGRRAMVFEQMDDLLTEAVRIVHSNLSVDFTAMFELCPGGESLRLTHGVGWSPEVEGAAQVPVDDVDSPGRAIREFVVQAQELGFEDDRLRLFRDLGIQSEASVAVQAGAVPFGVLSVFRRCSQPLAAHDLSFLRDIAQQISLTLQRRKSEMQYRERDQYRAEQMATVAQLATGVAHEIRNPLTSIKMLIQAGRQGVRGVDADDLEVIESEIRRMERSLNAFLEFARPAQAERKPVHLTSLVDRTLALVETRASRQGVALQRQGTDAEIWADQDQLQQLLLNLILNSLDATPRGGRVWVEIGPSSLGRLSVRVNDTGPGIPEELMRRLFQPFVSGKETGLGLGLVISKRIAEDHGGVLFAANRSGGGASFTLLLPTGPNDLASKE